MDESLSAGFSLVIGSGLASYEFRPDQLLLALKSKFGENDDVDAETMSAYLDHLLRDGSISEHEVREHLRSIFESGAIDSVIKKVATRPWKSFISISRDHSVFDELNIEVSKRLTSRNISLLTEKRMTPSQGSIPFFSLLGSIKDERHDHAACLTTAQYRKRRRDWRDLLKSFPDYNKSAPLVFMGTSSDAEIISDLITELSALSPGLPSKLIFFKGDPCGHSDEIAALLPDHVKVERLNVTFRDWLDSVDIDNRQMSLPLGNMEGINYKALTSLGEKVKIVPSEEVLGPVDPSSHNRVIDYLFRPSELNWEPYRQSLDFKREISSQIEEKIDEIFSQGASGVISLSGEAGVGKTVVMRRLAYDYANRDFLSIWLRRSLGYERSPSWKEVVRKISDATEKKFNTRVVFFLDGTFSRSDQLDELLQALSNESFSWCLLLCRRKTDEAFSEAEFSSDSLTGFSGFNFVFPNELSSEELARLPEYLVSIKAAPDVQAASLIVQKVERENAADVLCALWYILPQTRSAISTSLSEEYFALGGVEGMVKQFARASETKKDWARRAYELVTTCSGFDIPIPVEVLVRTLGIDYQEWLDTCSNGEPLWGLLYDESYKGGESYAYRTRNEVVTSVLLRTLNGGSASHIGEFRCLKDILSACEMGGPIYRETASSILIGKKKELKKRFSYEQGLELFDAALNVLPFEDRALVHHRGLWVKDMGGDLVKAYDAIGAALQVDDYPHSDRGESLGHIHTSLASCVVRDLENVSEGHSEYSSKLDVIKDHLDKAEEYSPFDLYNRHVSANMFVKVAEKFRREDEELYLESMGNAVRIISSSLSLATAHHPRKSRSYYESLQMLKELEEQLFRISDNFSDSHQMALDAFASRRDQTGFYVLLKILISEAYSREKGRLYKRAEDYLGEITRIIYKEDLELDPRIVECRADLQIKWHLLSKSSSAPNWSHLDEDLNVAIAAAQSAPILLEFYKAVTLMHLGKVNDAEAIFNQLRRREMPGDFRRARRCNYIDKAGNAKTFQGQIRDGYKKKYIYCADLANEFMCSNEFREKKDVLVHFFIAFSLQGPVATKNPMF